MTTKIWLVAALILGTMVAVTGYAVSKAEDKKTAINSEMHRMNNTKIIAEADLPQNTVGNSNSNVLQDALVGWSYTDNPVVDYFNAERDIFGVEFELIHNSDSNRYEFKGLMGDCDKITSYTLTEAGFTVVLNGEYKLLYRGISARVGINKTVNEFGYITMVDWYTINPSSLVEREDGYYITVPFNKVYKEGGITDVWFSFGKID